MKKLKTFLLLLVLFLSVYSQVFAQSYYITEEQLQMLEKESKEQKKLIEDLNLKLMNQQILVEDLKNQLTESKTCITQLEIKKYETYITTGSVCLFVGFVGGFITCYLGAKK